MEHEFVKDFQSEEKAIQSPNEFMTSTYTETIDDIEHPAWVTSFSDSCSSCISRISSFSQGEKSTESFGIKSNKFEGAEEVYEQIPLEFAPLPNQATGESCKQDDENFTYNEDEPHFMVSGSMQSLSSSSKTINASPRSDFENQVYRPSNKAILAEKSIFRRRGLYRERAPSVNALDLPKGNDLHKSKFSQSLHDVSSIPSNDLKKPLCRSSNTGRSLSALYSHSRSRDSGFLHSESLLSLSSSRNYDHVQSKVKQYIQDIKNLDAGRRKQRANSQSMVSYTPIPSFQNETSQPKENAELLDLVLKMKKDMEEKDRHLLLLQDEYNNLLAKYAEAENKIDRLRFNCGEMSYRAQNEAKSSNCFERQSLKIPQMISKTLNGVDADDSSQASSFVISNHESSIRFPKKGQKKQVVVSAPIPLRPISSLYCTSLRLDRVIPPLKQKSTHGISSTTPHHREQWLPRPCNDTLSSLKESCCDFPTKPSIRKESEGHTYGLVRCEENSSEQLLQKEECISHLPHEDSILKVQRWQKSLTSGLHPEICQNAIEKVPAKSTLSSTIQSTEDSQRSFYESSGSKGCSNIGIQVNLKAMEQTPQGLTNHRAHNVKPHSAANSDNLELSKLFSIILKEQDHVVPTISENEEYEILERKIKALKNTINTKTLVHLLHALLEKISPNECECLRFHKTCDGSNMKGKLPLQSNAEPGENMQAGNDQSLLQCLEEVDDYTNQVWAKCESFLEVLDLDKGYSLKKTV